MPEVVVKSHLIMVKFDSPREATNFWLEKIQNQTPSEVYAHDLILEVNIDGTNTKRKASIVSDISPTKFEMKDLKFRNLLRNNEKEIRGEMVLRRTMELRIGFGLCDGKYMLDHQDDLPVALQGKRITLSGTLFRIEDGNPDGDTIAIPQIVFENGRWQMSDCWIGDPLNEYDLFPYL